MTVSRCQNKDRQTHYRPLGPELILACCWLFKAILCLAVITFTRPAVSLSQPQSTTHGLINENCLYTDQDASYHGIGQSQGNVELLLTTSYVTCITDISRFSFHIEISQFSWSESWIVHWQRCWSFCVTKSSYASWSTKPDPRFDTFNSLDL